MSLNLKSRRAIGRQVATPPRLERAPLTPNPLPADDGMALPPTPGPAISDAASAPDPVMVQAKRDLDAGLVDTDMRATPGLDAQRRARLVPGAGGKPPAPPTLAEQKADFTAEGSPPPGMVAGSEPAGLAGQGKALPAARATGRRGNAGT